MLTVNELKQLKIFEILLLRKSSLTRNDIGDYPGDFTLQSGDKKIRSKIKSHPDFPGELTDLPLHFVFF